MEPLWNTDQTATYLGCTPGTLRVWVSKRRIPFVKVGRLVRFQPKAMEQCVEKNTVKEADCSRKFV